MLGRIRSSIASPIKPWHFGIAILVYALTWIVVSFALNFLGHHFGWSMWGEPFRLRPTVVRAIFWGVCMVGFSQLFRAKATP